MFTVSLGSHMLLLYRNFSENQILFVFQIVFHDFTMVVSKQDYNDLYRPRVFKQMKGCFTSPAENLYT